MGWNMRQGRPRIGGINRTCCSGGCFKGNEPYGSTGRWHHSREEAVYCDYLKDLKISKEIKDYRSQVRYDLKDAHGKPCGYMVVDFVVDKNDNEYSVVEYKGRFLMNSPEFRHKKALFTWCYPEVDYCVVGKGDRLIL